MADQNYVSDELIHFVARSERSDEGKQFKLLLSILLSRQLKTSYRGEFGVSGTVMADDLKELTRNEAVREAAVCFCDIPSDHLQIQMDKYGKFGIAFTKAYLLTRGASPVFYVARNSAPPPRPASVQRPWARDGAFCETNCVTCSRKCDGTRRPGNLRGLADCNPR